MTKVIGFALGIFVALTIWAWVVMVFVGALWHEFEILEPISFRQSYLPAAILCTLTAAFGSSK